MPIGNMAAGMARDQRLMGMKQRTAKLRQRKPTMGNVMGKVRQSPQQVPQRPPMQSPTPQMQMPQLQSLGPGPMSPWSNPMQRQLPNLQDLASSELGGYTGWGG